jgi:N-acetylglucosaminyl-diphospho-decaprenol L-rhamnosyltransferase
MDISIIIVNYKSKGLTLACLKSIKEADWSGLSHEIIVVDNNSHDYLGDILAWQYPDVQFIQAGANLGMGGGNNLGLARAKGKYVVIMNPDTIALPSAFKQLYEYMEVNPKVGIVGPKQFNPDKSVQDSCYRWHSLLTPLYRRTFLGAWFGQKDLARFLMSDFAKDTVREADWLLGSFLFIRAAALRQVGVFDKRFFLYFEDTDLCRRFWQKGWPVVYNPEAQIIHNHSRASARTPWYKFFTSRATRTHVMSWFKYLLKWHFK